MAKFYGKIGYTVYTEAQRGVWTDTITERPYQGDITRYITHWQAGAGENDNLSANNQISIIADAFAYQHLGDMRYVEWLGTKWKVSSFEVSHPRLILTIGGVWNGETT